MLALFGGDVGVDGATSHATLGIAGAVLGIVGNQKVARYKLVVGKQAHQLRDARRGCPVLMTGRPVLSGRPGRLGRGGARLPARRPDRGHGGDLVHLPRWLRGHQRRRAPLGDGVDPAVITSAEAAAGSVDGVINAHARARWTGRTLQLEVGGGSIRRPRSGAPMRSASKSSSPSLPSSPRSAASSGPRRQPLPDNHEPVMLVSRPVGCGASSSRALGSNLTLGL